MSKKPIYGQSMALSTDLYQLTMAYAHWKAGSANKEGVFNLFFRKNPFDGGYAVACGLEHLVDTVTSFGYDDSDLTFLSQLRGNDGRPLFEDAFLHFLGAMNIDLEIDAVPEGTVVFPHEPLVRAKGTLLQGTLFETPFLTDIGFPTLVCTKGTRITLAAKGEPWVDFGLRRAHSPDAALRAARAARIAGAAGTSNVLAAKLYRIPCKGTHAHAWVMSWDSELEAFQKYAEALPNNCVFLVDTYGTIEGIKHAIEVAIWLRSKGHEVIGVRLDSGDLAYLSKAGRRMLDKAGFPKAVVMASNDLDEHLITSLHQQKAKIAVWGIGTKFITCYDQPALGNVYKLAAWRNPGEAWHWPIKLSEQRIKITNPGIQQVRRFKQRGLYAGDMIFNTETMPGAKQVIVDPNDSARRKTFGARTYYEDLLVPVTRGKEVVYKLPTIEAIAAHCAESLRGFHAGIKRLDNPHEYPVGLEQQLFELKEGLILKARGVRQ